jgi:hypothetical protein
MRRVIEVCFNFGPTLVEVDEHDEPTYWLNVWGEERPVEDLRACLARGGWPLERWRAALVAGGAA